MAITRETLRLQTQLRNDLRAITDTQVRDLVRAWATAWDEVSVDLEATLVDIATTADGKRVTRAMVMRSRRLTNALTVIRGQLDTLATDAGVRITADLGKVVDDAAATQAAIVASQLPAGERDAVDAWSRVNPRSLAAIVRRSTEQITALTWPLSAEASRAVRRELIRGEAAGSNPRDVARKMVRRVEGRFNGGLPRATTIARTEMLDAHREAATRSRLANADVLTGWVWHAELSTRTCPACWAMDGTVHDVGEVGPAGHQNCRCTALPQAKSWTDLGFPDLDEPRSIKPNARTHFVSLPDADQRAILGPARWDAWRRGDYPMDAWSTVRKTRGWRDSIGVSPAPHKGGRSGSSTALAS